MSCTEAEAKTKWCPFYHVATSGGDPSSTYEMDNRPLEYKAVEGQALWQPTGNIQQPACCIGSRCMAWQWTTSQQVIDSDRGFCGLAHHTGYSR